MKGPVGLFPGLNIRGIFASAIMGLCDIKDFRCQVGRSMAQGQNLK